MFLLVILFQKMNQKLRRKFNSAENFTLAKKFYWQIKRPENLLPESQFFDLLQIKEIPTLNNFAMTPTLKNAHTNTHTH